jgi:general secretion pathway protein N
VKLWQLLGIGLGVYALALIAAAPATLIDAGLEQATEGKLRLAEARGTIWSGAGLLDIRDSNRRSGVAKSIAWRVLPTYLLLGQLRCDVVLDQTARRFPVTLSMQRFELADADINLPAASLGLGVPKLAPLGLTGDVLLHIARLSIGRDTIQGNATLQWKAAGSAYAPVSPLGDYELRFEGEGTTVRAALRTLQGPLQLDGQGSWTSGGNPTFLGSARVPPQHLQQLAPLLRMIAVERGAGNFELQLK